ncbi:MAG: stage III sporulation protein AF [Peptococcaceae bacterium]|nr:stage III sporulation protein AF [Peptococcaceae bacterium]
MEIVRSLVQNLIVIIIIAMLLEMFLPNGDMRRYVKMIMGLLIIVAVIQAVVELGRWDYAAEFPVLTRQSESHELAAIMENGQRLTDEQQKKALEEYKRGIARQVMALASTNTQISLTGVDVKIQSERNKPGYGQVKEMHLTVAQKNKDNGLNNSAGQGIKEVEPVVVAEGNFQQQEGPASQIPEASVVGLVETLAKFFDLSPEQFVINYQ